ncbi:MAG: helix-turn-helix domain-containing protein [Clostridium sp.]|nr:helix-turn-helix domain-containing protein [Clostridium sp.]
MVYDFGYRLKELRESRNLSQAQVASHLNVTRSAISNYEGNISNPSTELLSRLAILYHTTTDYLLGLDNRRVIVLDGLEPDQEKAIEDIVEILKMQFMNLEQKTRFDKPKNGK